MLLRPLPYLSPALLLLLCILHSLRACHRRRESESEAWNAVQQPVPPLSLSAIPLPLLTSTHILAHFPSLHQLANPLPAFPFSTSPPIRCSPTHPVAVCPTQGARSLQEPPSVREFAPKWSSLPESRQKSAPKGSSRPTARQEPAPKGSSLPCQARARSQGQLAASSHEGVFSPEGATPTARVEFRGRILPWPYPRVESSTLYRCRTAIFLLQSACSTAAADASNKQRCDPSIATSMHRSGSRRWRPQ